MPRASRLAASTRPLEFLCMAMIAVGLLLALQSLGGFFEGWRARGIARFEGGVLDPRFAPVVATMEGILGGSLVGKWSAAWVLLRFADPQAQRWSWRALMGGLVVFGAFEAFVIWNAGIPLEAVGPELVAPVLFAFALWRVRPVEDAPAAPGLAPRPLAWRALEAFAWVNVALGLVLGHALQSPPFAIYREAMSALWFEGSVIPHGLVPWFHYGYGSIGAVFAAQFFMLAMAVRHAGRQPWVLRAYVGTVAAWFVIDSGACLLQGAAFNVMMVNVPALAGTLLLAAWARRAGPVAR